LIKLLTRPGDLVLDLFAGSNTTGEAAESLGRAWLLYPCALSPVPCALFPVPCALVPFLAPPFASWLTGPTTMSPPSSPPLKMAPTSR